MSTCGLYLHGMSHNFSAHGLNLAQDDFFCYSHMGNLFSVDSSLMLVLLFSYFRFYLPFLVVISFSADLLPFPDLLPFRVSPLVISIAERK